MEELRRAEEAGEARQSLVEAIRTKREETDIEMGQMEARTTEMRRQLAETKEVVDASTARLQQHRQESQADQQAFDHAQLSCNELARRIAELEKEVVLPEDEEVFRQRNEVLSEANEELRDKKLTLEEHSALLKANLANNERMSGICALAREYDEATQQLSRLEAGLSGGAAVEAEAKQLDEETAAMAASWKTKAEGLEKSVRAKRAASEKLRDVKQQIEADTGGLQAQVFAEQGSLQTLQTIASRLRSVFGKLRDLDRNYKDNLGRRK